MGYTRRKVLGGTQVTTVYYFAKLFTSIRSRHWHRPCWKRLSLHGNLLLRRWRQRTAKNGAQECQLLWKFLAYDEIVMVHNDNLLPDSDEEDFCKTPAAINAQVASQNEKLSRKSYQLLRHKVGLMLGQNRMLQKIVLIRTILICLKKSRRQAR
ncbi:hypothetical protein Plhal304r1_c059g0147831 [Plasmopara halstedii]